MGGAMVATRVASLVGRNTTALALGYKHTVALLGDCPAWSRDRCGACLGGSTACRGCDGITLSGTKVDWCGACGGDNSTCRGCLASYICQDGAKDACTDAEGKPLDCVHANAYHPCMQVLRQRLLHTPRIVISNFCGHRLVPA